MCEASALLLRLPVVVRWRNLFSAGQGRKIPQSQIKANCSSDKNRFRDLHFRLNADEVFAALGPRYGHILHLAFHWKAHDHPHRPYLPSYPTAEAGGFYGALHKMGSEGLCWLSAYFDLFNAQVLEVTATQTHISSTNHVIKIFWLHIKKASGVRVNSHHVL